MGVVALASALVFALLSSWLEALLEWLTEQGGFITAVAPAAGGLLAVLVIHLARTGPGTADVYVLGLRGGRFDVASVPARAAALMLGVGSGVPLGYEGPAVYFGGSAGAFLPQRRGWRERPFVLAAATAAVAVVLDAPLAAALFAVEVAHRGVPRRADVAPIALGAAAAWAVSRVLGQPESVLGDVPGGSVVASVSAAVTLGLVGGLAGRAMVRAVRWSKQRGLPVRTRLLLVPFVLLVVVPVTQVVAGQPVLFGSGRNLVEYSSEAEPLLVVLMLVLFAVAVVTMVAGGVVGGLFLPLVAIGSTLGLLSSALLFHDLPQVTGMVFGACGVLAAAYGCPLTAVALAASRLGVGPELLFAAGTVILARRVAGPQSVSIYQS